MLKKNPPPWKKKQTQAGAILFEENEGKRRFCGYKSERFTDAEIHYHSTFKEILAVKRGIESFQFHLVGYDFLVEMDMSSFPKMVKFKQKQVPHPQLLRWAKWFFRYHFDVKHIQGKTNVLVDILSRPTIKPAESLFLKPLGLYPKYPFINPINLQFTKFPKELKWMFWYLTHLFHIGIIFPTQDLQHFLTEAIHDEFSPELKNLVTFFKWFYPLEQWADMIMFEFIKNTRAQWIMIIFYKPQYFMQNVPATQLRAFPSAWIHKVFYE
uniref:Reverse transcriptase RNase H-like domain-containing protein n=1 Tax=Gossypium raimondii TaxID=29730 RepID=A0A0D2TKZ6_GOSRA|nr:hypothetical protein B456_012G084900 [Gossypium raimondii]